MEAAVAWYRDVLGLTVLSPPYLMEGEAIAQDMGELVPSPRMKAEIVGFGEDGDRVLEVIEYPDTPHAPPLCHAPRQGSPARSRAPLTDHGLTHVALLCDDIDTTRTTLETPRRALPHHGYRRCARLRTTWIEDPWGVVFIVVESRVPDRRYFAQYG